MSVISSNPPDGAPVRTPKKAALASFMGSAVEYYDFFVFGFVAALIFPKVFFDSGNEAAQLMSFATLGVAYIARPVGAFVIRHFGDRIGRKTTLVLALSTMGASTVMIGLLPTYAQQYESLVEHLVKKDGKARVFAVLSDVPGTPEALAGLTRAATEAGGEFVGSAVVPPSATDYTPAAVERSWIFVRM